MKKHKLNLKKKLKKNKNNLMITSKDNPHLNQTKTIKIHNTNPKEVTITKTKNPKDLTNLNNNPKSK